MGLKYTLRVNKDLLAHGIGQKYFAMSKVILTQFCFYNKQISVQESIQMCNDIFRTFKHQC